MQKGEKMLTISEKKWLKARRLRQATHHIYHRNEYFIWSGYHFAEDEIADLKDALKFSERVAEKLAKHIHDKPLVCETNWDCPYWPQGKCAWCYLKVARLEVEEEMDNEP